MIRRIARPLLASVFIHSGYRALVNPAPTARAAEPLLSTADPVVEAVADSVPGVSPEQVDARTLARLYGGVQLGAALLLATGRVPRTTSLILAGSMIPAAITHAFWLESDPQRRQQQTTQFLKDLSLTGGLIIAGFDTEGQPGTVWRAKRAARRLQSAVPLAGGDRGTEPLADRAAAAKDFASHTADVIADNAAAAGNWISHAVDQATPVVTQSAAQAAEKSAAVGSRVARTISDARQHVPPQIAAALDNTTRIGR
ncbi:DoxX family protein [Jongsikchunia kroppenstedtii]|uniref:DoxX family protein n=1 Tax=Jongsikchunia kroppenstedtii TaxID=1121721 RepID=UPI00035EEE2F|nr:DoxX family protein [Jongsikchunia kroppenstedtii]